MNIENVGRNPFQESIVDVVFKKIQAQKSIESTNDLSLYSEEKTVEHPIQIKRMGHFIKLPEGVSEEFWTTPSNARNLQQFQ